MKIGIVGLGYWGNIILKNLEIINKFEIVLCDNTIQNNNINKKYSLVKDFKKLECDSVFITTPTITHFEISKFFLENNTNVFCEKPLSLSTNEVEKLYETAFNNDVILFTDWIFTFNSHIKTLKEDYDKGKLGKIKSILMNRLNLGPERFDTNARWDLASHDVSIIQYLFSDKPIDINWIDYKRNVRSKQDDSCLGLIKYQNFTTTINVSWYYMKKVRDCVFEFENFFILWDDFKRILQYEDSTNLIFPIYSGNLSYPCSEYHPPLINSINSFFNFSKEDMIFQKKISIETTKILEGKIWK